MWGKLWDSATIVYPLLALFTEMKERAQLRLVLGASMVAIVAILSIWAWFEAGELRPNAKVVMRLPSAVRLGNPIPFWFAEVKDMNFPRFSERSALVQVLDGGGNVVANKELAKAVQHAGTIESQPAGEYTFVVKMGAGNSAAFPFSVDEQGHAAARKARTLFDFNRLKVDGAEIDVSVRGGFCTPHLECIVSMSEAGEVEELVGAKQKRLSHNGIELILVAPRAKFSWRTKTGELARVQVPVDTAIPGVDISEQKNHLLIRTKQVGPVRDMLVEVFVDDHWVFAAVAHGAGQEIKFTPPSSGEVRVQASFGMMADSAAVAVWPVASDTDYGLRDVRTRPLQKDSVPGRGPIVARSCASAALLLLAFANALFALRFVRRRPHVGEERFGLGRPSRSLSLIVFLVFSLAALIPWAKYLVE